MVSLQLFGASRVDVQGTTGSQVVVEYTRIVSADSREEEARILQEREATLTQTGNTISLVERRSENVSNGSFWKLLTGGLRGARSRLRVAVKIPAQFNVDLRTSGGGIELTNVSGQVDARTSGGSLTFRDITGNIEGRTSGRGIKLVHFKGDADLSTSGGIISPPTARAGSRSRPRAVASRSRSTAAKSRPAPRAAPSASRSPRLPQGRTGCRLPAVVSPSRSRPTRGWTSMRRPAAAG